LDSGGDPDRNKMITGCGGLNRKTCADEKRTDHNNAGLQSFFIVHDFTSQEYCPFSMPAANGFKAVIQA